MADQTGEFWDQWGRGPMQREFHRRAGYDPAQHAAGFASWAKAFESARGQQPEWPDQFRAMLVAVVRSVLDAERTAMRADAEAWIETRLVPVREAYAALLERVRRLEQAGGGNRPPASRVRPPRPALAGGQRP